MATDKNAAEPNVGVVLDRSSHSRSVSKNPSKKSLSPRPTGNCVAHDAEKKLVRKVDLRLCTIAGLLCSLNLLDSGIISSASVTSMLDDLELTGNRYSVAIFIFILASIAFQLPATICMRFVGPPVFFGSCAVVFGLLTICTAYITTWRQMIAIRVLLGISMAGIFPGLTYLISTWYTRREQQLRFAFLQSGEVTVLATGSIVNYGLNHLDHRHNLRGWQWMYIVQGSITIFLGLLTFIWVPHFPENAHKTSFFLTKAEMQLAIDRINHDRDDSGSPEPFSMHVILRPFLDPKLYAFSLLFFLLNFITTALAYFLPQILQRGMGLSSNQAILLSAPPYYYTVIPALLTSYVGDKYKVRGPIIAFNSVCLIVGLCMLGFAKQVAVRYVGVYLATGAYVSNWAALAAYQANNITGQWKRAVFAAALGSCNGAGGIAGSYIFRAQDAPRYTLGVSLSVGSQVLTIVTVLVCTVGFWWSNKALDSSQHHRSQFPTQSQSHQQRVGNDHDHDHEDQKPKQKQKQKLIEGTVGFRYTY